MKPVHARIVHRYIAQTSRKPAYRHGWCMPEIVPDDEGPPNYTFLHAVKRTGQNWSNDLAASVLHTVPPAACKRRAIRQGRDGIRGGS